jgi:hypothetical protein
MCCACSAARVVLPLLATVLVAAFNPNIWGCSGVGLAETSKAEPSRQDDGIMHCRSVRRRRADAGSRSRPSVTCCAASSSILLQREESRLQWREASHTRRALQTVTRSLLTAPRGVSSTRTVTTASSASRIRCARSTLMAWYSLRSSRDTTASDISSRSASSL